MWRPIRPPDRWPRWQQAVGALLVFVFTTLAWVPFRTETLTQTWDFWRHMFTGWDSLAAVEFPWRIVIFLIPLAGPSIGCNNWAVN